jgi:hypothetical protein
MKFCLGHLMVARLIVIGVLLGIMGDVFAAEGVRQRVVVHEQLAVAPEAPVGAGADVEQKVAAERRHNRTCCKGCCCCGTVSCCCGLALLYGALVYQVTGFGRLSACHTINSAISVTDARGKAVYFNTFKPVEKCFLQGTNFEDLLPEIHPAAVAAQAKAVSKGGSAIVCQRAQYTPWSGERVHNSYSSERCFETIDNGDGSITTKTVSKTDHEFTYNHGFTYK